MSATLCILIGWLVISTGLAVLHLLGRVAYRLLDGDWDVDSDAPPAIFLGLVMAALLALLIVLLGPVAYTMGCAVRRLFR